MINIEIVEFYPIERNEDKDLLSGTLRVRLCDFGIDILGIFVSKRKDFWYFTLPGQRGIHHETGESIRYPYLAFEDREKQRALMEEIRSKGRVYIEKRLADKENELIFRQNQQKQPSRTQPNEVENNQVEAKETPSIEKNKPFLAMKEWRDKPQRKFSTKRS